MAVAIACFAVALLRHETLHSSAYDLAFFDQVVWNAAHGGGLRSSFIPYPFFGQHFEPALAVFVPLYRWHASPLWLLGAQAAALGAAVVPLAALVRSWTGSERAAVWAVAGYLVQPGLARAVGFDFHTEALAVPFVFAAMLGAVRGDPRLLLSCGMVPILCKEDGALVSFGIGVLALTLHRRSAGALLAATSLAAGAFVVAVVMPHIRDGAPGDLIARYRYLGSSPGAVIATFVMQPQTWLRHVVERPAGPALLVAIACVGLLPLLRPVTALGWLPPLLPALLSTDPFQAGLRLHYGLPAVPLLVVSAVAGALRLSRPSGRGSHRSAVPVAFGAVAAWLAVIPRPVGLAPDSLVLDGLERRAAVEAALDAIPPAAELAATGNLLPHLAERPRIWELPGGVGVPWIAVDDRGAVTGQSRSAGYAPAVRSLASRGYRAVARAPGVTVWRLGATPGGG